MFLLGKKIEFPDVELASPDGILAIGGDLSPERLLLAYQRGIFPWFSEGEPIVWYSPEKRMVLFPKELKVSKSMKQLIRKETYRITWNQNFEDVIEACQASPRKDQDGTWITEEMRRAYIRLHELGHAKSVEVWRDEELVGGLYGIDLGHVFCGESMFSRESNTSKLAFINLVQELERENYRLIDCQIYTAHLASLGAREIPRKEFTKLLTA
ncbi:MAG: leucyl/phenylalanyl-tRNA--protein transferase [Lutimonas sp.]